MNLDRILHEAARRDPAGTRIRCGARRLGYGALEATASRMAALLSRCGVGAGDRVAALFPNCHAFLAGHFAVLSRGAVLVPLNTRLTTADQAAVLRHSAAVVLLGAPEAAAALAGACGGGAAEAPGGGDEEWSVHRLPRVAPEPAGEDLPADATHLYYTSGTTGSPKGVILTRGNQEAHVVMTRDALGFTEADVWLHAAPMFHLADAWAIWTVTAAGATHVLMPRFDAAAAYDLIASERVTITNLVPVMLQGLLAEAERRRRPLPSLRLLLSGGAPIAPATVRRVGQVLGCAYAQTYGLTETAPFLTLSLPADDPPGVAEDERLRLRARAGRPAPGVALRVVAPPAASEFADVPADDATVGEVVARGPTVTPGYYRDPAATRAAFAGGWFHTGDLATRDAHGSIRLVDRIKDVVKTGGETVYTAEVEHVLHEHPAVREAAVFGVPDDTWGEAVHAAVALRAGDAAAPEAILAFCRGRLAGFKCPRVVAVVAALPRTASGKIDKKALREPFWKGRDRRIN